MLRYLRLVWPYLARYKRHFVLGAVAIAATNTLAMFAPLVLRRAINRLESGTAIDQLAQDAMLIIALAFGAGVFRFLVRRWVIWASRLIEYDLRGDLFAHVSALDQTFFDRTSTGDIITRASSDVEQVRMMVGPGIMQGTNTLMVGLAAVPLMIHLDWQLALWALAPLPLLAILTNRLGGIAHRRNLAVQDAFSRMSAFVQETLSGIRVLKAHAREDNRSAMFDEENSGYFHLNMRLTRLYGSFMPMMSLISGVAIVLVLYFGGRGVVTGRIDLGTLVAFAAYMGMLIWPMVALGWVVSLFQRGLVSAQRINAVLSTQPRVVDPPPGARKTIPQSGALEFRSLTFSYNGNSNAPVLRDVTFAIEPGETVAIAGPTGSGKSTVAHLLWRRYPVADGAMLLGGTDANRVPVSEWRRLVAMVPQEAFLFSESLASNIALGSDDIPREQVMAYARDAAFDKDVQDFPRGYDTMVGERGITLSGGQKQRAALARALAVDSRVLVLDDAFSAVDAQTEQEILTRLATLFGTRMILMITHRLATLRKLDRVLFFERGRLTDSGAHDALIVAGGPYARWAMRRTLEEELEEM
ncbi:MAG TPA: ABC transporter ATP-binding protein [candidate division Zixibacteria bacterium]